MARAFPLAPSECDWYVKVHDPYTPWLRPIWSGSSEGPKLEPENVTTVDASDERVDKLDDVGVGGVYDTDSESDAALDDSEAGSDAESDFDLDDAKARRETGRPAEPLHLRRLCRVHPDHPPVSRRALRAFVDAFKELMKEIGPTRQTALPIVWGGLLVGEALWRSALAWARLSCRLGHLGGATQVFDCLLVDILHPLEIGVLDLRHADGVGRDDSTHRFGDVARGLALAWLQLLARCWMSALIETLRRKLSSELGIGIGDGIVFLLWFWLGSRRFRFLYDGPRIRTVFVLAVAFGFAFLVEVVTASLIVGL